MKRRLISMLIVSCMIFGLAPQACAASADTAEVWERVNLGGEIVSHITQFGDEVLAGAESGRIYRLDGDTWRQLGRALDDVCNAIGYADGTYYACADWELYAFMKGGDVWSPVDVWAHNIGEVYGFYSAGGITYARGEHGVYRVGKTMADWSASGRKLTPRLLRFTAQAVCCMRGRMTEGSSPLAVTGAHGATRDWRPRSPLRTLETLFITLNLQTISCMPEQVAEYIGKSAGSGRSTMPRC